MRTKLVLWGTNANDDRVLLALQLFPEKNEVTLYVFTAEQATDAFTKELMDEWRNDKEVAFPEGHLNITQPLTMTETLIPEEYKVERGDIVQRAQSEWAFVVLSYKMQKTFQSELDSFQERINQMTEFSQPLWEEMKGFWDKVQGQVRERNLFREHVAGLREQSNDLFNQMKKFRQAADNHFRRQSAEVAKGFSEKLEAVQAMIEEGKHLINTFEDLKKLQREYHDLQLTRDDRNKLWARMDAAFKLVKEKRFGNKPGGGAADAFTRVERRHQGLVSAIEKMNKSIHRDEKDLHFEEKRADNSESQLEMQIRQAKINMITERVNSKKEKLADMVKTREDLERRMTSIKSKVAEEDEKKKMEEAKLAVKERIAKEIEETSKELEDVADKLEAAAHEITHPNEPVSEVKPASDSKEVQKDTADAEAPAGKAEKPVKSAKVKKPEVVEVTNVAEASLESEPTVDDNSDNASVAEEAQTTEEVIEAVTESANEVIVAEADISPEAEGATPEEESVPIAEEEKKD